MSEYDTDWEVDDDPDEDEDIDDPRRIVRCPLCLGEADMDMICDECNGCENCCECEE